MSFDEIAEQDCRLFKRKHTSAVAGDRSPEKEKILVFIAIQLLLPLPYTDYLHHSWGPYWYVLRENRQSRLILNVL